MKSDKDRVEEALDLIAEYGSIDGAHHKQWVLDQLVRILTPHYEAWVMGQEAGEDGPDTYYWDVGIAP